MVYFSNSTFLLAQILPPLLNVTLLNPDMTPFSL